MGLLWGIVAFALGILIAVCLHEAGHMVTAKAFGMKVTRYFVGFGPTLFSFRKGETEYGVKAIPLGGFVKIVGMTPQEDDVEPGDEERAMWRFPVWKRTVVLVAGSVTHFVLAFVALWVVLSFVGVQDNTKVNSSVTKVDAVWQCVSVKWQVDPKTKVLRPCDPNVDPKSPAAQAGLKRGDVITAINGQPAPTYADMRAAVRGLKDTDARITYVRDRRTVTTDVHVYAVARPKESVSPDKPVSDITADDLESAGMLGISAEAPLVTVGAVTGAGRAVSTMGKLVTLTVKSFQKIPEKIPNLIRSITGSQRDPETPVSVVGASRIGGELISVGAWTQVLSLFAVMNLFFGIFNLLPLLPMDGGHVAIAWFERVRSWIASRRGRPDPGRVDYVKLTPVTLAVISVLGAFVLLTVTADIVNPISIFR